jgi:hypothetical protein
VQFDTTIAAYELPAFRGAIIKKVGREHDRFHNHLADEGFLYRYPLIQYKRIRQNPAILCLDEGVEEIHHYFAQSNWDIEIGARAVAMKIAKLDMHQFTLQVGEQLYRYHIQNWIALHQKAFAEYQALSGLGDKIAYLERKMVHHIVNFAKEIAWQLEDTIQVKITAMNEPRPVRFKAQELLGFNLDFETNVFLPNYIGLGGKVGFGYGVVKMVRD